VAGEAKRDLVVHTQAGLAGASAVGPHGDRVADDFAAGAVGTARALAPPKLDQRSPVRAVLPSPQVRVTIFGRLLALVQLVILTVDVAEALAPTATRATTRIPLITTYLLRSLTAQ
jgi:hypothetical protein